MGLLQGKAASRQWFSILSDVYDPVVAETFWPAQLQRQLLERVDVDADDRVLDVGCGTGQTTACLDDQARQVAALDHSTDQLAQADDRASAAGVVCGDAEDLPFADESFDLVVSVGAVIYFPDPTAALAEAYRVTRPGGRILVAGFNRPTVPSWNPVENWATAANETFFHTWDDEQARDEFTEAGWQAVESEVTGPAWHPRLTRVVTAEKKSTHEGTTSKG